MKSHLVSPFALCIAVVSFFIAPTVSAVSADDQAARDAALQWLNLVDAGRYVQAYQEQPPRITAGGFRDNFVRSMQAQRAPLGRARTRTFYKATHVHQLVGCPDGNYQMIGFKTSFERKVDSAEALILTHETGRWQVSGYKIY